MSYCSNLTWSFAKIWCTIFFFFFLNFWIDWDCYSSQCIKSETKTCCVGKIQESVCSCMISTLLFLSVGFDMYWCCFQRFGYSTSMLLLLLLRMNRWIWLLIMIYQPIHMIMFIVLVELLGIDVLFFFWLNRAGRSGVSLSLVTQYDVTLLKNIEKTIGKQMTEQQGIKEDDVLLMLGKVCSGVNEKNMNRWPRWSVLLWWDSLRMDLLRSISKFVVRERLVMRRRESRRLLCMQFEW